MKMRHRVPLIVLVCATLLSSHPALAQFSQQGPKLVGAGAAGSALQGWSVSLSADGNTAIVGGRDNSNAGAAWVWTRSGGVWTQQGSKLVGSGAVGNNAKTSSVSLSADGNTAIVGGPGDNGNAGAAWVWTRSGGVWTQQGTKLVGSGAVGGFVQQGWSVSLSADGNTAIIGGNGDNSNAGAAWVWTRSGGVWTQQGTKLVGSGAGGGNVQQGYSVSLSGDGNTAIVGAGVVGAAWVWTRSGGGWTQQGTKLAGGGGSVSLSADGNTAIVSGGWVWTRSGGVWTQQWNRLPGGSSSLSAYGNTAIIGGPSDNGFAGAAWVWTRSGGVWTQQGTKLVGSGAVGSAQQGYSVSLSADGNTAIVGGLFDNGEAGAAWVFAASAPAVHTFTTTVSPIQGGSVTGTGTYPSQTNVSVAVVASNGWSIWEMSTLPDTNCFEDTFCTSVVIFNSTGRIPPITSWQATALMDRDRTFAMTFRPVRPFIFSQPTNQVAAAGATARFSVQADGYDLGTTLDYHWRKNGVNIAGATNSSLSLTNVQFANAGGYSVVVTNGYGSVASAVAQLTVYTNMVLTQTNRAPTTNEIGKPTIPTDPNHFKVFTNGNFQSGVALNPNKMTVVLTHGWNSSSANWPQYMAGFITRRIGSNVVNLVAWDWTTDAHSEILALATPTHRTSGNGIALGTNLLAALGANYSQRIHFVGHSLGTLVNAAAANYVHGRGFSWTNTQMTLCDDAEIAWDFSNPNDPQFVSTVYATLKNLEANFSTAQPFWGTTLPNQFAWADNYITAFGLLHPEAANAILTDEYPRSTEPNADSLYLDFLTYHDASYLWYDDTIVPSIFNPGGPTNATYLGFICSFEGGGAASRSATNTYFYQDPNGLELNLVQTNLAFATNFLNARFSGYFNIGRSSLLSQVGDWVFNGVGQAVGAVNGVIQGVGNNVGNMFVNLFTTGGGSPQIQSGSVHSLGGPVPNGGPTPINTSAYAWIPITVPSNAVSMSFDFMLQGNGNQDSFQVALNGTNILSLETSLIQTNVTLNSGLIGVSQYAGQQVELFLGIVGGTSTNAALTVSNFQFYVTLPPSLQIQLAGTNVVLTWPLSGAGYVLQSANQITPPISWTTVTNVPVIVNFQYTVTNQISGDSRFYRLAIIAAPALQAQIFGSSFVLSWPASAQNFSLQTTTNLADPNSWTAVADTPAIVNLQCLVTNQISGAARFYRLRK
jgi:pimeloyl-ACP methyl ester carboxylesterase